MLWKSNCVVAVQIKELRDGSVGTLEEEKNNKLYFEWLSGSARQGVATVGKEVRMLTKWLPVLVSELVADCAGFRAGGCPPNGCSG